MGARSGRDRRHRTEPVEVERRKGDRRRWKRVPVQLWAEATDGAATYYSQAADLSAGGVFFAAPIPLPIGTVVTLGLELPEQAGTLEVRGVVVNAEGGEGMGVRFVELSDEDRVLIDGLLARLDD